MFEWWRRAWRGRRRVWLVVPVVLVVAAGGGAWLMTRDSSAAEQPTTMTVTASTMKETVAASGTIEPARSADLDFEVSGTVTHVYVAEGDRVHKGQALARIDDDSLVANRTAAAAALSAAYTQLDDDQDADADATQLASDQAAIVAAKATLTEAQQSVSEATLRATISGTVVALDLAKGDVVGSSTGGSDPSAAAATSTASSSSSNAVSIVATRSYIVDATVSSEDVDRVKKGLQAEITPTGATDPVYGTVKSVGLVAETNDSGAAVFPVTIEVTGKRKDLYAGTSADASIIVKQVDDVLTVPSRALQTKGGSTYVEKVVNGTSVRTKVETGTTYGMSTEITSGLKEGDEVEIPGFSAPSGGGSGDEQRMPDFGGGDFPPGGGSGPGMIQMGGGQ